MCSNKSVVNWLKTCQHHSQEKPNFVKIFSPGVNFTNIVHAAFLYESFCAAFKCLQFGFVIFWQNDFGAKAAH